MSIKEDLSCKAMQVIINENQGFRHYRKRKVQGLTAAQSIKRLRRCEKFSKELGKKSIGVIVCSGEKLFRAEHCCNVKSYVVYLATYENIHKNLRTVKFFQDKKSGMV